MRLSRLAFGKLMGGAFALSSIVGSAGCGSNTLETGYAYTPLGSSPQQRRGYYAGAYSPEAREAAQRQQAGTPGETSGPPRRRG